MPRLRRGPCASSGGRPLSCSMETDQRACLLRAGAASVPPPPRPLRGGEPVIQGPQTPCPQLRCLGPLSQPVPPDHQPIPVASRPTSSASKASSLLSAAS